MNGSAPTGVLLLQLGTPASPRVGDVRRYLREFLSDPRVLDVPTPLRWLLLYGTILPLRPRRSAAAYRAIWTAEGSPLLVHSRALADALAKGLGDGFRVELGMRYGEPRLQDALDRLLHADVERIVALPLFPQYAAASTGSALERLHALLGQRWNVPALTTLGAFYDEPGFIAAMAALTRPRVEAFQPDHVLLSYHGLPERQLRRSDAGGAHCFAEPGCCDTVGPANRHCYRAQCYATSRAIAVSLDLPAERFSTSFQSRLGRAPWIRPYTDHVLPELADRGVRRLMVLCPSFVADCLETVEEIGIRAREQWREVGGEALDLVPCVNASPAWVRAASELITNPR